MEAVLVARDGDERGQTVSAANWRRVIHLAQWAGWTPPPDHWTFSLDAVGAKEFTMALESGIRSLGEPPRTAAEVAVDVLAELGLDDVDAHKMDALQGLSLSEARSCLRDFFVREFDGFREACGALTAYARGGPLHVSFAP